MNNKTLEENMYCYTDFDMKLIRILFASDFISHPAVSGIYLINVLVSFWFCRILYLFIHLRNFSLEYKVVINWT